MVGLIFEDVRRIVLGLLFVVAFGWVAALVLPGEHQGEARWQQMASAGDVIAPQP
ncbi:MAG: hypothetical protein M0006_06705 [Magnetospirillum sp.]|nr:hypothetical protein [Magnetospirillum sp.]